MLRTLMMACLLAMVSSASASAQEWARKMFPASNHDFGSVARGAKADYRFTFKNLYEEEIHIASVRSSCGCTQPKIENENVKSLEEGAILAAFNTRDFLGQKSATITVVIDQPFHAEVQLHVAGYIRSDVVLHPGAVALGAVDRGHATEKKIAVNYAGRNDWKILEVKSASPYITGEVVETKRGGGQVSYELTVKLQDNAPVGYINEQITLVTNDRRAATVPVDIEGRIVSEVTISPASLLLGVLEPGKKVTKQLVVKASKPFSILDVLCENENFSFKIPSESKTVHLVSVTFEAGAEVGQVTQKITILTDLGEEVVAECSAHAQIVTQTAKTQPTMAK